MTELDVVAAFRRQLADIPEPRRRPRALPAAAVAAVIAVALLAVLSSTTDPSSALAITRDSDWIEMRIADPSATADELTRELEQAGIRGRVKLVPVAPEHVGVWVLASEAEPQQTCAPAPGQPAPQPTVRLHEIERVPDVNPTTLRLPVNAVGESSGSFLFVGGRPAGSGERVVDVGSSAAEEQLLEIGRPPATLPTC